MRKASFIVMGRGAGFQANDHADRCPQHSHFFRTFRFFGVEGGHAGWLGLHYEMIIQTAIAIIIRFSVRDTKPRGTFELPPTQAHLSSRLCT